MAIPVFPSLPGITYPVKYTVLWDTVKADAISGKRVRLGNWTYPVKRWDLPVSRLARNGYYQAVIDEWATLTAFVNYVQGATQLWAYNDPNDNSVTLQPFGEGDGTTTSFQLVRSLGGFTEPVFIAQFPANFPTIYVGGVATLAYVISPTGLITFNAAPAAGAPLTWSGNFWWPCRFDDDTTDLSNFMFNVFEAKSLKFSSEKLDTTTGGVSPTTSTVTAMPLGMP